MTCQLARGYFRPVYAKHLRYLLLSWPVLLTGLLVSGQALADDSDPSAIEKRLKTLESTAERQALVREPAAQARRALKRVLDARTAGDAAHAVELAALANDWVNLAANLIRATELEKEVAKEQARLSELEQKRRRTETLLEATIAQRERTREELKRSSGPLPATGQAQAPQKTAAATVSSAKAQAGSKTTTGSGGQKTSERRAPQSASTTPTSSRSSADTAKSSTQPSTTSRGK